jgi:hypothetical protein
MAALILSANTGPTARRRRSTTCATDLKKSSCRDGGARPRPTTRSMLRVHVRPGLGKRKVATLAYSDIDALPDHHQRERTISGERA